MEKLGNTDAILDYFHQKKEIFPDEICNSPYCQPENSHKISSEKSVLDQLIIPNFILFFILINYLVDIVRRNSVLLTHGS